MRSWLHMGLGDRWSGNQGSRRLPNVPKSPRSNSGGFRDLARRLSDGVELSGIREFPAPKFSADRRRGIIEVHN